MNSIKKRAGFSHYLNEAAMMSCTDFVVDFSFYRYYHQRERMGGTFLES
jgi:hypothetical protein